MVLQCSICDYKCAHKFRMVRHINEVHAIEKKDVPKLNKPFKCSVCDYQSGQMGHITRHFKAVHPNLTREVIRYENLVVIIPV
jgi:hypothetical protein